MAHVQDRNPDIPAELRTSVATATDPAASSPEPDDASPGVATLEETLLRSPRAHAFMWLAFVLGVFFGAWRG